MTKNGTLYKKKDWLDEHVKEIHFEAADIELVNENVFILGIYESQKGNMDAIFNKIIIILNILYIKYSKKTILTGGDFNIDAKEHVINECTAQHDVFRRSVSMFQGIN